MPATKNHKLEPVFRMLNALSESERKKIYGELSKEFETKKRRAELERRIVDIEHRRNLVKVDPETLQPI